MKLAGLALLFLACLVAALIAGVLWWPRIAVADAAINDFFGPYREQPFVAGFIWLTGLGANPAIAAVCLTMTGLLWTARRSVLILPLWIAFLGGQATSWSLKYLVGRARPEFLEFASATSPSFPSGHSTSSMAVYGFVAFVLAFHGPGGRLAILAPAAFAALIALIGFSRIFLSLHHASDVLGGWLVGGFWLLMATVLSERLSLQDKRLPARSVRRRPQPPE
jgi:undecaprenyl-diphosphatase